MTDLDAALGKQLLGVADRDVEELRVRNATTGR
jgi:hypothetical protein